MMSRYTHLLAMVALVFLMASGPAFAQTDYDTDNDNLIDVTTLAQLNAIRYDLDGNGVVAATDMTAYNAAFPNPASGMGCAATCTGYELMNNLNFDENSDGQITVADAAYWNGGAGWTPIGVAATALQPPSPPPLTAKTSPFPTCLSTALNTSTYNGGGGFVGLFGDVSGTIRDVGL